jgi:hypothetical protein
MAARGELFRGLAIGIVIGAAITVAIYQLRGGALLGAAAHEAPTAACPPCAPGTQVPPQAPP